MLMLLKMRFMVAGIGVLALAGCQDAAGPDRTTKLEQVRSTALKHVAAEDRDAFQTATLVVSLEDLPAPGVGLRVPIPGSSNAVFVLFEVDYFDAHGVEKLAAEAVEDYVRSKQSSK
jgi:hypothetical protein